MGFSVSGRGFYGSLLDGGVFFHTEGTEVSQRSQRVERGFLLWGRVMGY